MSGQDAYFDMRVTNPICATAMKRSLRSAYDSNERRKKRQYKYNHRVITVGKGIFTPLVFSVFGTSAPCQSVKRFSDHCSPK